MAYVTCRGCQVEFYNPEWRPASELADLCGLCRYWAAKEEEKMSDSTKRYSSVKGLLAEAEANLATYNPEDIKDEDGALEIVVDTITSAYDFTAAEEIRGIDRLGIDRLGGDASDCCDECKAAGELREECDWLTDTLETLGDAESDRIAALMPPDARGSFYFTWHEGAYVLMYRVEPEEED